MRNRILYVVALLGVMAGFGSAYVYGRPQTALPPAFSPAPNPYPKGVYATGIVESYQSHGENINIYPEVSGVIRRVLVAEQQVVTRGTPLLTEAGTRRRSRISKAPSP